MEYSEIIEKVIRLVMEGKITKKAVADKDAEAIADQLRKSGTDVKPEVIARIIERVSSSGVRPDAMSDDQLKELAQKAKTGLFSKP